MKEFVITPYGEKLNTEILEVFTDMDLSNLFIQEVKNKKSPRKGLRKPCTPTKLVKEEIKASSRSNS